MSVPLEDMAIARTGADAIAGQNPCIRVLVVDDQRLFRESIAGMLALEPAFKVVGVAADGAEGVELTRQLLPDVVLMDVKMPQMDGIAAMRQIKAELPKTRIILLTTFTADGYVLEGLAAGANGYLLKDTSGRTNFRYPGGPCRGAGYSARCDYAHDAIAGETTHRGRSEQRRSDCA